MPPSPAQSQVVQLARRGPTSVPSRRPSAPVIAPMASAVAARAPPLPRAWLACPREPPHATLPVHPSHTLTHTHTPPSSQQLGLGPSRSAALAAALGAVHLLPRALGMVRGGAAAVPSLIILGWWPACVVSGQFHPTRAIKQPARLQKRYLLYGAVLHQTEGGVPTQGTSLQRRAARYLGPRPSASRPVCAQYRWRGSSTVPPVPPARTPLYLAFPGTCTRCGPVRLPSLCLGPIHHFHSLPLPPRPSSLLCFLSSSAAPLLGVVSTSLFLTKPILLHLPAGKEASPFPTLNVHRRSVHGSILGAPPSSSASQVSRILTSSSPSPRDLSTGGRHPRSCRCPNQTRKLLRR